jgi:hypothetical protein
LNEIFGSQEFSLVEWLMGDFVLHIVVSLSSFIDGCDTMVIGSIKDCNSDLIGSISELLLDLLGHNSEDSEVNFIL